MHTTYKFNDDPIIAKIHASSLYGRFFEVGAGQPIAGALFEVEGASNTINVATSPYSKSAQDTNYSLAKNMRFVCAERIEVMLNAEMARCPDEDVNLFVATSFTLPNDACAHGYIGIAYRHPNADHNIRRIYHITLPRDTQRAERIELVGHIGVRLIGLMLRMRHYPTAQIPVGPFLNYIDDVRTSPEEPTLRDELVDLYYYHHRAAAEQNVQTVTTEHAIVIRHDGNAERFESLCRRHEEIAPYKGSFSILHNMHASMAYSVMHGRPISPLAPIFQEGDAQKDGDGFRRQVIFTICVQTYGKGTVNINDLHHRIDMILEAGYPVMLLQQPLFKDNFTYLRTRTNQPIIFIAGADTLARMTDNRWIDEGDVRFAWFHREDCTKRNVNPHDPPLPLFEEGRRRFDLYDVQDTVSSRNLLRDIENDDLDAIQHAVPAHVYRYYVDNRLKPKRMTIL